MESVLCLGGASDPPLVEGVGVCTHRWVGSLLISLFSKFYRSMVVSSLWAAGCFGLPPPPESRLLTIGYDGRFPYPRFPFLSGALNRGFMYFFGVSGMPFFFR